MRVFHHGSYRQPDVAAEAAVERSLEQALRLFAGIHGDEGFLGIELSEHVILQFRSEEGVFYTEVLDTRSRKIEHCLLSTPLAEEVIRVAYAGGDFRRVPTESFVQWKHGCL